MSGGRGSGRIAVQAGRGGVGVACGGRGDPAGLGGGSGAREWLWGLPRRVAMHPGSRGARGADPGGAVSAGFGTLRRPRRGAGASGATGLCGVPGGVAPEPLVRRALCPGVTPHAALPCGVRALQRRDSSPRFLSGPGGPAPGPAHPHVAGAGVCVWGAPPGGGAGRGGRAEGRARDPPSRPGKQVASPGPGPCVFRNGLHSRQGGRGRPEGWTPSRVAEDSRPEAGGAA